MSPVDWIPSKSTLIELTKDSTSSSSNQTIHKTIDVAVQQSNSFPAIPPPKSVNVLANTSSIVRPYLARRRTWFLGAVLATLIATTVTLRANIAAEKASPDRKGSLVTLLYTLVFIVRKSFSLLMGGRSAPKWTAMEELVMRTLNFYAHIGDVNAPNQLIDLYAKLHRLVARPLHGLFVTDIGPEMLGFGSKSAGRAKFRKTYGKKVTCSAQWIALSPDDKFGKEGQVTIFYTHGGGFCIGNSGMYMPAFGRLLRGLRARGVQAGVLSIDYPLSPAFAHPIPIESCAYCYDYLVHETGVLRPENIVIAGDSAGGLIALAIAQRATKYGAAGCILISPWVGHGMETNSHKEFEQIDFIGGRELIRQYQAAHAGSAESSIKDNVYLHLVDDTAEPMMYNALPPCMMTVGTSEVFHDDCMKFAGVLEKHDVPLELVVGEDCPHIFPCLWPMFLTETEKALEVMVGFVTRNVQRSREETNAAVRSARLDSVFSMSGGLTTDSL